MVILIHYHFFRSNRWYTRVCDAILVSFTILSKLNGGEFAKAFPHFEEIHLEYKKLFSHASVRLSLETKQKKSTMVSIKKHILKNKHP
ncbi:unnamed protein product [Nezara viridula]|uniref:Uncharacterized protein n=1 Tax=Nezara viridula TaxID=85310 RepID=A0A9P0HJI3_NEZVI|nr:unnamed protein product [Nezara viridula]